MAIFKAVTYYLLHTVEHRTYSAMGLKGVSGQPPIRTSMLEDEHCAMARDRYPAAGAVPVTKFQHEAATLSWLELVYVTVH